MNEIGRLRLANKRRRQTISIGGSTYNRQESAHAAVAVKHLRDTKEVKSCRRFINMAKACAKSEFPVVESADQICEYTLNQNHFLKFQI